MTLPIHALRVKLTAAALAAVVLTAGHAVAKNHDCQSFKLASPTLVSLHDRAPGPTLRNAN
ncbi:hypothetical protein I3A86_24455 [Salmonella enterica]|nr:hypothetical protein [Salmonella enterica]